MKYRNALRVFRRQTAPPAATQRRVLDAVRRRAAQRRCGGARRVRFALAAGAVGLLAMVGLWTNPQHPAPQPLSGPLSAEQSTTIALTPLIQADVRGVGELSGDSMAPRIAWTQGALRLDVTPEQGIDLHVHTQEAHVQVVGTVFQVNVDRLGSHVNVEHGAVQVRCDGAPEAVTLIGGQQHTCIPTTAGRILLRLTALLDQGAPPQTILQVAERGLAAEDLTPTIAGQFRLRQIDALLATAQWARAANAIDQYLVSSHPIRRAPLTETREALRRSGY